MARRKKQKIVGGRIVGGPPRSARDTHPLQVVLQSNGLTQSDLAQRSGVSAATICRVLTGRDKAFTVRAALKIREALDGTISLETLVIPQEG